MEIIFLPAWANSCVIVAVLGLIGMSFGPKVANKITVANAKAAYYIIAMSVVAALGAIFALLAGISVTGGVLSAYAVIGGVGLFVALLTCLGTESPKYIPTVGGIVALVVVFATLAFANIAYATVWLSVLTVLLFVGRMLFPKSKTDKK